MLHSSQNGPIGTPQALLWRMLPCAEYTTMLAMIPIRMGSRPQGDEDALRLSRAKRKGKGHDRSKRWRQARRGGT